MSASKVATQFDVRGRLVTLQPLGAGNVNDTYRVIMRTTFSEEQFVLQKINQAVFTDPAAVMSNMQIITDFAHQKIEAEADDSDRIWQLPRIIQTKDGKGFVVDDDGEYWRGLSMIASTRSYEKVESPEVATEAGRVLGHFQRIIADCPLDDLQDTLPGFHITPQYLEKYDAALSTDRGQERLNASMEAMRLGRFVENRRDLTTILQDAFDRGELTIRPIHGDPKITNIMIDQFTGKGTCIIDLDTVKPGLIHYDFGDAVRSSCNPAGEETDDLSEVYFDVDLFEALFNGYLKEAGEFLTDNDKTYLFDSIRLITFELGLRFFADYLAGDVYFKTIYDGQNLNRARVQFALCESIEAREPKIRRVLDAIIPN